MSTHSPDSHFDVAVIGGGIHGVSMACEAASRGLNVILLQGQDIASGASSATSTMLSGGLRKLEQLAVGQVRRNLIEQAIMLQRAPHLIRRRRYTIVEDPQVRSSLRLRAILWMYRRLQQVPRNQDGDRRQSNAPQHPLKEPANPIYEYDDCSGLDYRLTVCTALQARNWGADIRPRHRVVAAQRQAKRWLLTVQPQFAQTFNITATSVINSCGWLANDLLDNVLKWPSRCRATPVNVGYVIVRKTYPGDQGYVLQAADKGLIYATPLLEKYLVIGPVLATNAESKTDATAKLIALYNRHFNEPLTQSDLMHERWAKHALFEDPGTDMTPQLAEAVLDLNNPYGGAPLLNVFGIDFVMHRLLSERGLDILQPFTGRRVNPALRNQALPGGDIAPAVPGGLAVELKRSYPELNPHLLKRLALTYGTLAYQVLGERHQMQELGQDFGRHLYQAEVAYLQKHEWAVTAEDILWRRTQLGIKFTKAEADALQNWLDTTQ